MNERDIKNYFANASLSEQKKDQLKETLKKRFPQQNGDINTNTFTPQTEPTQPAIVARHKGAKVVAAAAAVVLVMSGGIYMTRHSSTCKQQCIRRYRYTAVVFSRLYKACRHSA